MGEQDRYGCGLGGGFNGDMGGLAFVYPESEHAQG